MKSIKQLLDEIVAIKKSNGHGTQALKAQLIEQLSESSATEIEDVQRFMVSAECEGLFNPAEFKSYNRALTDALRDRTETVETD